MTSPVTNAIDVAMAMPAIAPMSAMSAGGWPGCHKGVDMARKVSCNALYAMLRDCTFYEPRLPSAA